MISLCAFAASVAFILVSLNAGALLRAASKSRRARRELQGITPLQVTIYMVAVAIPFILPWHLSLGIYATALSVLVGGALGLLITPIGRGLKQEADVPEPKVVRLALWGATGAFLLVPHAVAVTVPSTLAVALFAVAAGNFVGTVVTLVGRLIVSRRLAK